MNFGSEAEIMDEIAALTPTFSGVSFGFLNPETGANVVTTEYSDWATNCPEYKVTAVQVALSVEPSEWQQEFAERAEKRTRVLEES